MAKDRDHRCTYEIVGQYEKDGVLYVTIKCGECGDTRVETV
jgi:hypothetical protein